MILDFEETLENFLPRIGLSPGSVQSHLRTADIQKLKTSIKLTKVFVRFNVNLLFKELKVQYIVTKFPVSFNKSY